jgi:copper resistance protein B
MAMKMLNNNLLRKKIIAPVIVASISTINFSVADDHMSMHEEHKVSLHENEHMHDHGDNPVLTKVMFDQLELRNEDGANPLVVDAQVWIGKDLNKFWFKTDFERRDGVTEDAEVQGLYSRAIAPYWDLQIGIRQDLKPTPNRTWGVIGFQGLAPYFFEVDAAFFVGESGKTALRISTEYELLFTQKLILSPELSVDLYGQNDWETDTGSGLSDLTAGLRLRYEIKREFAPYIGVNWSRRFGTTAEMVKNNGESARNTAFVAGLRMWF